MVQLENKSLQKMCVLLKSSSGLKLCWRPHFSYRSHFSTVFNTWLNQLNFFIYPTSTVRIDLMSVRPVCRSVLLFCIGYARWNLKLSNIENVKCMKVWIFLKQILIVMTYNGRKTKHNFSGSKVIFLSTRVGLLPNATSYVCSPLDGHSSLFF